MENLILFILAIIIIFIGIPRLIFNIKRNHRRNYYRNEYLQSEEWQRKRYVVLKRDNYRCVYCGAPATQVHHKRYAKRNIGREPIAWLVSICKPCHDSQHRKKGINLIPKKSYTHKPLSEFKNNRKWLET